MNITDTSIAERVALGDENGFHKRKLRNIFKNFTLKCEKTYEREKGKTY